MHKQKSFWTSCGLCGRVFSNRDHGKHERSCQGHLCNTSGCKNQYEVSVSGDDKLNSDLSVKESKEHSGLALQMDDSVHCHEHDLAADKPAAHYGYIANGSLHAVILPDGVAVGKDHGVSLPVKSGLVFMSPSTMRVAQFPIGHPVAINNRYSLTAWPLLDIPDGSVKFCASDISSELPATGICEVRALHNVSRAAQVTMELIGQSSGSISLLNSDDFKTFVAVILNGRRLAVGNKLTLRYFGKTQALKVTQITNDQEECLSSELSQLNLSVDRSQPPGDMTSTPVSKKTDRTALRTFGRHQSDSSCLARVDKAVAFHRLDSNSVIVLGSPHSVEPEQLIQQKGQPVLGGMDQLLEVLRELIIEPIEKKELYQQHGIPAPRGVLLYGPPGCGKTLLSVTLASRASGIAYVSLDASSLWSKHFGDTEERIRKKFQTAKDNAPSIIFIDDIDTLCPRRERSQSDIEKRVLSALVSEIDAITESCSQVFILAATNKLDGVDMSLRRPGRLDREIEVPAPSAHQRAQIIQVLLRNMKHTMSPEDIKTVALDCNGYVGADLYNLCREAGLSSMKSNQTSGITPRDFVMALSKVQPSAMREIYIDIPKVKWSDIGGLNDLKEKLKQAVVWPIQHPECFVRLGVRPPKGLLMYGPPGCSKTMIAKALATETSLNFISIKGPELFSKWVGESEKAVREVFKKARNAAPSIVFFDEIDAVAVERGKQSGSSGVGDRVLAQLLTELDGVEGLTNVTIIAATNRPDMIDKALLRPGRLDRLVYVPLPDESTRTEIFALRLRGVPLAEDVKLEELVQQTPLYSGAEVTAVCNEAAMQAMREDMNIAKIEMRHFSQALGVVRPQTTQSMLKYYQDYATQ